MCLNPSGGFRLAEPEQPAETLAQKTTANWNGVNAMKNARHRYITPCAVWVLTVTALCAAEGKDAMSKGSVVWTSPSQDSRGSMPIGNGDFGAAGFTSGARYAAWDGETARQYDSAYLFESSR